MLRPAPAAPTPNYVLRRVGAAVVALIVSAVLALGALGAVNVVLTSLGGDPAVAADGSSAPVAPGLEFVVAEDGDSLWSIAAAHRGAVDLQRYVQALIARNGGTAVVAGQIVWLP